MWAIKIFKVPSKSLQLRVVSLGHFVEVLLSGYEPRDQPWREYGTHSFDEEGDDGEHRGGPGSGGEPATPQASKGSDTGEGEGQKETCSAELRRGPRTNLVGWTEILVVRQLELVLLELVYPLLQGPPQQELVDLHVTLLSNPKSSSSPCSSFTIFRSGFSSFLKKVQISHLPSYSSSSYLFWVLQSLQLIYMVSIIIINLLIKFHYILLYSII